MKIFTYVLSNFIAIYTGLVFSSNVSSDDLAQFQKTKSCIKCDLAKAYFSGDYKNAILNEAKLMHCNFAYNADFDYSIFNNAYLIKAKTDIESGYYDRRSSFRQASFVASVLTNAMFKGAEFSGANYESANLTNANLENSNLSNTDFTNAILDGINLKNAILIGSNISSEQLAKASSISCAVMPNGEMHSADDDTECNFN